MKWKHSRKDTNYQNSLMKKEATWIALLSKPMWLYWWTSPNKWLNNTNSKQIFQKTQQERTLSISFYEASITFILKLDKDIIREKQGEKCFDFSPFKNRNKGYKVVSVWAFLVTRNTVKLVSKLGVSALIIIIFLNENKGRKLRKNYSHRYLFF